MFTSTCTRRGHIPCSRFEEQHSDTRVFGETRRENTSGGSCAPSVMSTNRETNEPPTSANDDNIVLCVDVTVFEAPSYFTRIACDMSSAGLGI